jgi:hypothetical protein
MAKSIMLVYEPLSVTKGDRAYWESYISFYEKFWDHPSSPKSIWYGTEYEEFKTALSRFLDVEIDKIENCFFFKDNDGQYYLSPLGSEHLNALVIENAIPESWFVPFDQSERNFFYTHTGFGAITTDGIYYKTKLSLSLERIKKAQEIIGNLEQRIRSSAIRLPFSRLLSQIHREIKDLEVWLTTFDKDSFVILNYGDISSHIHPQTFKNENTAMEIWEFLSLIELEKFEEADLKIRLVQQKWKEIKNKASGEIDKSRLQ